MTTRITILVSGAVVALLACASAAPIGAAARVVRGTHSEAEPSLAESQMAARQAASKDLALEPAVVQEAAKPVARIYDLAIVPFKNLINKEKAGLVYDKTRVYFGEHQFKVVPRPQVEGEIKELGLLSNEAIQMGDCDTICRVLGVRYLAFGTVKLAKADTGFSPVGSAVGAANMMMGGLGALTAATALPFVAGTLAVSSVAGFTATSQIDMECRIYDNKVQKIIWVGSETFTAKKHLMAMFADKKKLQEVALTTGLKKLFDPIVGKLQPMKSRSPVD